MLTLWEHRISKMITSFCNLIKAYNSALRKCTISNELSEHFNLDYF